MRGAIAVNYMMTPAQVSHKQKGSLQPSLLEETGVFFSSATDMTTPTPVSHRQKGSLQPSLLKEPGVFFSSTAEAMMIDCILSCVCGFCLKDAFVCLLVWKIG